MMGQALLIGVLIALVHEFIGYMPQDVELFDGTVATNIARFPEIDADAIVSAAKKAGYTILSFSCRRATTQILA